MFEKSNLTTDKRRDTPITLARHSRAGGNLGKVKFRVVSYRNKAKHVSCLDPAYAGMTK